MARGEQSQRDALSELLLGYRYAQCVYVAAKPKIRALYMV